MELLIADSQRRSAGAMGGSLVVHAAVFTIAIWLGVRSPDRAPTPLSKTTLNPDVVWLDVPGPIGGGGRPGGDQSLEPPRIAQLKGDDAMTVPVQKPPDVEANEIAEHNPVENLVIPAETLTSANTALLGAMEGIPTSTSLGPGTGPGTGTGSGPGVGSGDGSGFGPGSGPGSGIESPVPLSQPKPQYTAEAMRAKIQGRVLLECVILPDGTVGEVRVLRSLDPIFGLD